MAEISGTIIGATLVEANFNGVGDRELWRLSVDFGAYTGAADTATITGVAAAISNRTHDGKTRTLRGGLGANPGSDTNGQAVYFGAPALDTVNLDGTLANAAGTELTTATASKSVGVIVAIDAT